MSSPFITIPTYYSDIKTWAETSFATREDFVNFLKPLFKEPGKYGFDENTSIFNAESARFKKDKVYCFAPYRSKDFVDYWEDQKQKSRRGIIVYSGEKTWYVGREYYFWLNFLPIYDKEQGIFDFAKIRDAQYHMQLYETIARYSFKHAAILKKRQIASSYFHAGAIINHIYFEEGFVAKMAGSLKDYINEKGTWRFLEEYRNFLNTHTAWYRPFTPDKVLNWEQKIEVTEGGRKKDKGLKSALMGLTLDKDPTNGVGGPCGYFFHEEAGIAPKMNMTLEYLLPALKSGMGYTGFFVAAGSVGDLDQCEPLKQLIMNPASKDVYAVPTNLVNDQGETAMCGLFIPEQWSMNPCIDKYGNSLVEEALEMIINERLQWKEDLTPDDYQLRVSQKPINIAEAFATRNAAKFPPHLVNAQLKRIEDKTYHIRHVDLWKNEKGKIEYKDSRKIPISHFPISPQTKDKEGVVVMVEEPLPDVKFGTYLASIDPVGEGKTTTSDSLCSIYIYRQSIEVTKVKLDGTVSSEVLPGKIVAYWCGRFDDINKTHERLEHMIELYNAWALIENNISLFIQHMIGKRKQKYLVPKSQVLFLKDAESNKNVFQEYGWKNTGRLFKDHMLSYGIEFIKEETNIKTDTEGEILHITYGVERIPDKMLLQEMQAYREGLNVDRLVAYCALVAFVKVMESNYGFQKRTEKEVDKKNPNLEKSDKNTKLKLTPFRNIGQQNKPAGVYKVARSPFRNIK